MKIFEMTEAYWWMAPDRETAIQDFLLEMSGVVDDFNPEAVRELTDDETARERFHVWGDDDDDDFGVSSFAEELARRVALGAEVGMFACTEY